MARRARVQARISSWGDAMKKGATCGQEAVESAGGVSDEGS
jgi:hypothetical protein